MATTYKRKVERKYNLIGLVAKLKLPRHEKTHEKYKNFNVNKKPTKNCENLRDKKKYSRIHIDDDCKKNIFVQFRH